MSNDLSRLLHVLLHPAAESCASVHWSPPVDIYRTGDGWLVKFDLAGVLRTDLQLTVSEGRLMLSGRRRDRCIEEGAACSAYSMEITYSDFQRTVELPSPIESMQITTDYRDGMLLVRLVAQEETR
jgi:HSP20 family protein